MPTVKRRDGVAPFDPQFPGAAHYRARRPSARRLRESNPSRTPSAFTERHLQCVWFDPQYRPAGLISADGESVHVSDPGRWNLGPGPDFLDAAIQVGPDRRTLRGDVELHIRTEDWTQHAHAADPQYRRVVAHVTYWPGRLPDAALPAATLQIALKGALDAAPNFYFDNIDVTAYPYSVPPHAQALPPLAEASPAVRAAVLAAAGAERLRLKAEIMAGEIERLGPRQALYEAVLGALGYQANRGACRHLARLVTLDRLEEAAAGSATRAYALLLGVAGLLPETPRAGWDAETRRWHRTLWDAWWRLQSRWGGQLLARTVWRVAGIRPQNHPVRRLAAAAALFTRRMPLDAALLALDASDAAAWMHAAQALCNCDAALPYWQHRLSLGSPPVTPPLALIGDARSATILTNVFVPYVAARGQDVGHLLTALPAEASNQLSRHAAHVLFGPDYNPATLRGGLLQQGLLQIFHDFCLTNRTADLANLIAPPPA